MRYLVELARCGLTSLHQYPGRSFATLVVIVVGVLPYTAGLGISQGVRDQAQVSILQGADLYLSEDKFGRPGPLPNSIAAHIRSIPGVRSATPRIVGSVTLGIERIPVVVVGVPIDSTPTIECIEGRLPHPGPRDEIIIGTELAQKLHLKIGAIVPPFYRNPHGERLAEVVGIFRSDALLWQARMIFTTLETAARIFNQPEMATDIMVTCEPGYHDAVRRVLEQEISGRGSHPRLRIVTRDDLVELLPASIGRREGVFTLHMVLAFACSILVIMVTSAYGATGRRREIGILKALGWQTHDIMIRALVESGILAVSGVTAALALAFLWLRGFNGYWIAGVFLPGVDAAPAFRVPFRLVPGPALLCLGATLVIVLSGTLISTWRASATPPRTAMR